MAALDGGEALVTAVYKTVEANAGLVISPARQDYQAGHLPRPAAGQRGYRHRRAAGGLADLHTKEPRTSEQAPLF